MSDAANDPPAKPPRPRALDIDHEVPRERPRRGELHGGDNPWGYHDGRGAAVRTVVRRGT